MFSQVAFDAERIAITEERALELSASVIPLKYMWGQLYTIEPCDLFKETFIWAPTLIDDVTNEFELAITTEVMSGCGHHNFYKPSIAEILAQYPTDFKVDAFALKENTVRCTIEGKGHLVMCNWFVKKSRS